MSNRTHTTLAVALFAAVTVFAGSVHAASVTYDFEVAAATGQNLSIAAASNDFGSGITASTWDVDSGSSGRPAHVQPLANQDGSSAHDSTYLIVEKGSPVDVHTFTITIPNVAGAVTLTNLSFDFGEVGPDNGAPTWTISSDLGGGTITPNTANGVGTGNWNTDSASLALGGSFSSLNNTSVTFTLSNAAGGNNSNNGWGTWIDNVVLTGAIVPAPAALPAGLAMLGLVAMRRRRTN